jgi:hypothetical protein
MGKQDHPLIKLQEAKEIPYNSLTNLQLKAIVCTFFDDITCLAQKFQNIIRTYQSASQ